MGVIVRAINDQSVIQSGFPTGTINTFVGTSAPVGWLLLQGQSISRTAYPALFALIGTTYGSVDANSFSLPDFRGEFLRGVDLGKNIDPNRTLGSVQTDAMQQIFGQFNMTNGTPDILFTTTAFGGVFSRAGTFNSRASLNSGVSNTVGNLEFDSSRVVRTATETRPINVALQFIIKT